MIRNALRKELSALLTAPAGKRQPVIRRSLTEAWLYATDLPALNEGNIPESILSALTAAGWAYLTENNWLLMTKPAAQPPEDWYAGPFGPEAVCCRSLLDRHPPADGEPSDAAQRMLIKAGEEGEKAYEEACAVLHREWAERLRTGESLPDLDRRYFGL
ncbi:MAG: hypothetical protein IKG23_12870 [Clostridia bacterium]|nr:hypothetical protein [Clostridia bacterium]